MRVRDLGALTVVVDTREQPIVGAKAAAMLALLAINANRRVSVDGLMEAAWGDRITEGAASTLTSHIWRLRQVLEPGRDRRQPPTILVSDSDGYRLVCSAATLDSLMFAEAANDVRDLLAAGDVDPAVRRAESALSLWRGTPYGDFAEEHWAQAAVARLVELRGQLHERRIEALVHSGAVDAALNDLDPLIAEMPLRQSLRALQMQALHGSGRGDEALQAYEEARRVLLEEVGIEPGHELEDLHRRMLDNDPALILPAPPARRGESAGGGAPAAGTHATCRASGRARPADRPGGLPSAGHRDRRGGMRQDQGCRRGGPSASLIGIRTGCGSST